MQFHQVKAESIILLKEASLSFLAVWYFKFLLKCAICSQNLWFFAKCKKMGVFPKYMKIKTDNTSAAAKTGSKAGLKKWIQEEMKSQLRKRGTFKIYQKVVHTELLHRLHNIEFSSLDLSTREKVNTIIHKKYLNQKSKLNYLSKNSNHYKDKILHKQYTAVLSKKVVSDIFIKIGFKQYLGSLHDFLSSVQEQKVV